jgi:magnesium transporter
VDFGEVSVFVGPSFVIAVRQGVASDLHGARIRLEQRSELLQCGTSSVLWAILDQVVDGYGPAVAELERDIEQVERTVFAGSVAPTERIYFSPPRGDRLLPRSAPAARRAGDPGA